MDLPPGESESEVRTVWYSDPVIGQESFFTKRQVFFICFIIPTIVFWLPALFLVNPEPHIGIEITLSDLVVFVLYLLLPFSFFMPARIIGGIFKNYGYYGALTSAAINFLIFTTYTNGLYF